MTTDTNKTGAKRNRRTRQEILADLQAKIAKVQAQVDGTYDKTQDESFGVKRLRSAIRRRETAITQGNVLLNGRNATEKSPAISDIDTKIANAEQKLANLRAAKVRATEQVATLPFDVDTLRGLLARAEAGEVIEFPTNLYPLPTDKLDAEMEAGMAVPSGD